MIAIVGVFVAREDGERAVHALGEAGFSRDRITLLTPDAAETIGSTVATTDAEPPGFGRALGGVVGGAAGASGGMQAGALVSLVVPGVGPVLMMGAIGAVLFGLAGVAIGEALDRNLRQGLPRDEVYVYEDALRRGRTVVVALAEDEGHAARGRSVLGREGAETIDAAREQWWLGLRDAEAAEYTAAGGDFARDETPYRCGFEAALRFGRDDRAWESAQSDLRARYPEMYRDESFRRGYERGRAYCRTHAATRRAA